VTALLDEKIVVDRDVRFEVEALFREARRRRRRRWVIGCGAIASSTTLGVLAGVSLSRAGMPSRATVTRVAPPGPAVTPSTAPAPVTNLDILSGSLQLRVRIGPRADRRSNIPAAPGVAPPLALARVGYLIGTVTGRYESVSDDLRTVLYRWPSDDGQYPAPAGNPSDVWLTRLWGDPSQAQEFDSRGDPAGPPVTIPAGMLVRGEVGSALVLQGPPPSQDLALWDARDHRLLAGLGPWDQETSSGSLLAWTTGSVLRVADPTGSVVQRVEGPAGNWATSLAFSPDGHRIAIVWAPRPGTVGATRSALAQHGELDLVTATSGATTRVGDSRGATGPVAWSPDGRRIFFGQTSGTGSSSRVASYGLGRSGAARLRLPGVNIPAGFGPSTGALVSWRTPSTPRRTTGP
jgi:hypothetical protein